MAMKIMLLSNTKLVIDRPYVSTEANWNSKVSYQMELSPTASFRQL